MPKVIISCAVTGSIHTPSMSPYLPVTPDQIAEQAIAAAEAGAAILHLHARDPVDGRPAFEPAVYRQFLPRIHAATDAVINITTGGAITMTLDQRLAAGGFAVVQTTSPLLARRSFWTVVTTLEAVGLATTPYHAHVPSFGEWGFVIASRRPWRAPTALLAGLRFLTPEGMAALRDFPPDMARVPTEVNRLSNQVLVHEFEAEWGKVH